MTKRVLMGLGALQYYQNVCPFLDWLKISNFFNLTVSGSNVGYNGAFDAGVLDSTTGNFADPPPAGFTSLQCLFHGDDDFNANSGYDWDGAEFTLEWVGDPNLTIGGSGCTVVNNLDNTATITLNTPHGAAYFTVGGITPTNKFLTPKLYLTEHATRVANGEIFNPDWLDFVKQFVVLRMMDWMNTNFSWATEIADFPPASAVVYNVTFQETNGSTVPFAGMPLEIMAEVAKQADTDIQIHIPHLFSEAASGPVDDLAQYYKDNVTAQVVHYERSNETWNTIFDVNVYDTTQANIKYPGVLFNAMHWSAYQSARCLDRVRVIYADRTRWRGVLGSWTTGYSQVPFQYAAIDDYLAEAGPVAAGLTLNDLFDGHAVAGYFGGGIAGYLISDITQASPAVVTAAGHTFANGDEVKIDLEAAVMDSIRGNYYTLANVTSTTFELVGSDTSSEAAYPGISGNRVVSGSTQHRLMDASEARAISDPTNYPDDYQYYKEVTRDSILNGSAAFDGGYTLSNQYDIAFNQELWNHHLAAIAGKGIYLQQYEGGNHIRGNERFQTDLGARDHAIRFTTFLHELGRSAELAPCYEEMCHAFLLGYGKYPAIFVDSGNYSIYGIWGIVQAFPGDEDNPVALAVLKMSTGVRPFKLTIKTAA